MFTKINYDLESLSEMVSSEQTNFEYIEDTLILFKQDRTAVDSHLKINIGNDTIAPETVITLTGFYDVEKQ